MGTRTFRRKYRTSTPSWLEPWVSTVTTPRSGFEPDSFLSRTLVSAYNERDGKKTENFGPRPEGYLHLGPNGRFSYLVFAKDAPKFAANSRMKVTAEEAQAVVQSSIAYYGTYKTNPKDGTLDWNIEHTTFPNNKGMGKRSVKFSGDEMTMSNTGATAGGTNVFVWKRAK